MQVTGTYSTAAPPSSDFPENGGEVLESKTTWKTHALVVSSYLLFAIGIALACASPFMVAFAHPMVAMASPALPIALGALGLTRAHSPPSIPAQAREAKLEKGQPIGLRNTSANCWLNAALQMFFNVPAYRKALEELDEKYKAEGQDSPKIARSYLKARFVLKAFDRYKREQNGDFIPGVSSVDSQKIRESLYDRLCPAGSTFVQPPMTSRKADIQEDAMEAVKFILETVGHFLPTVIETNTCTEPGREGENVSRYGLGESREPFSHLALQLGEFRGADTISLQELLHRFFSEERPTDSGVGTNLLSRCMETPPSDLTLQLYRDAYAVDEEGKPRFRKNGTLIQEKIRTPVEIPLNYTFSEEQFGQQATYQLDAFLVHRGTRASSGHYVSYVKDANGLWWLCNDSHVTKATEDDIARELPLAYILHYDRSTT